jgi:hypothetical protein
MMIDTSSVLQIEEIKLERTIS